ncbi:MAG: hypothetical protein J0H01_22675 [Rhizobiales bacterium]|nr:hypothetical protein [Hyphomicrobiales bacterium]
MPRFLRLSLLLALTATPAAAQGLPDAMTIFRTACIGGQFAAPATLQLVRKYAQDGGFQLEVMPPDAVHLVNRSASDGWRVGNDRAVASVMLASRQTGDAVSRSCNVTTESLAFEEAKRRLSADFSPTLVGERTEGTVRNAVYAVKIAGYDREIGFSVRSDPQLNITSVTFMEIPPN